MHYSYSFRSNVVMAAPAQAITIAVTLAAPRRAPADRRWPRIVRTLKALRDRGRRSIRIIDANCGAGDLLLAAVRHARTLGFVAIEGRGIDGDPRLIQQAIAAARTTDDPAIGLVFEAGDPREALRQEAEFPADIVLYAGQGDAGGPLAPLARAAGVATLRISDAHRIAA